MFAFVFVVGAGCARPKWTRYYNFESNYSVDLPNSWSEEVMSPDLMRDQMGVQLFKEIKSRRPTGVKILISNWRGGYLLKSRIESLKAEREAIDFGVLDEEVVKGEWFSVAGDKGQYEFHYVFAWERGDILQVKCVVPAGGSMDAYKSVFDEIVMTFQVR